MRPLVLDASAALAHVLDEPGAERVRHELEARDMVLVPWFFWMELINVLARRYRWSASEMVAAVYDLEQAAVRTSPPSRPVMLAVIDTMDARGLSAYDAQYLVLAEAADAELLTADARLAIAAGDRAIRIGLDHRVNEAFVPYLWAQPTREPEWPRWPGAAAYLAELRREAQAELDSLRP
jgi:predicted nucleic acid-binding protein